MDSPSPPQTEFGRPIPRDLSVDGATIAEREVGAWRARIFSVASGERAPYQFRVTDARGRIAYDRILEGVAFGARLEGPEPLVGRGSRVLLVSGRSGRDCCAVVWLFDTGERVRSLGGLFLGTPQEQAAEDLDGDGDREFVGSDALSVPHLDASFSPEDWPRVPVVYEYTGEVYARAEAGYNNIFEQDARRRLAELADGSPDALRVSRALSLAADYERLDRHPEATRLLDALLADHPQWPKEVRAQILKMLAVRKPVPIAHRPITSTARSRRSAPRARRA